MRATINMRPPQPKPKAARGKESNPPNPAAAASRAAILPRQRATSASTELRTPEAHAWCDTGRRRGHPCSGFEQRAVKRPWRAGRVRIRAHHLAERQCASDLDRAQAARMPRRILMVTSRARGIGIEQPAKTQRSCIETRAAMMSRMSEPPLGSRPSELVVRLATPIATSMDHSARVCRAY